MITAIIALYELNQSSVTYASISIAASTFAYKFICIQYMTTASYTKLSFKKISG